MKILYSCLSRSWGGMEMFTITAAMELRKHDINVEILCFPRSRIHQEALEQRLICHTVKASGYFHPFSIFKILSIIKKRSITIIHSQASKDLWVLSPAKSLSRKKIHLLLTKQVGSFILKKDILHRYVYNKVDIIFAISEVIKKNLLDTCPVLPEKIRLLHNGIDTSKFDPSKVDRKSAREELKLKPDEIAIGMLARFSIGKGHEEVLHAAEELSWEYKNLKFLIAGEASRGEEDYAHAIYRIAETAQLRNVVFTGFRKDTDRFLSALDIFVFPSHSEAFGIALVEAMSMELPSVCSNSDGILDIAQDGITGYLFEKKNAVDLAGKLRKLIDSPDDRKKFGIAARKRAMAMFDLNYLTNKVIDYYKAL